MIKSFPETLEGFTFVNRDKNNPSNLEEKYGFTKFKNLFGREPALIDIQNCFCETDKYLRAKVPELQIDNVRIKQKYKRTDKELDFFFPPKWELSSILRN